MLRHARYGLSFYFSSSVVNLDFNRFQLPHVNVTDSWNLISRHNRKWYVCQLSIVLCMTLLANNSLAHFRTASCVRCGLYREYTDIICTCTAATTTSYVCPHRVLKRWNVTIISTNLRVRNFSHRISAFFIVYILVDTLNQVSQLIFCKLLNRSKTKY